MEREILDILDDILHTAKSIQGFVQGMTYDQFTADEKTFFAVIQGFEIIGEAAKHIPKDVRIAYPEIAWNAMARMRDLLIHHYFGTNYAVIWETIEIRIPPLIVDIQKVIKDYNV